jgi:hypothetical protein
MAGVLLVLKDELEEFAANQPQIAAVSDPPVAATVKSEAAPVEVADEPGAASVPEAAPVAPVDTEAVVPAARADTVIAEPDAAPVSTTDGAVLTTTADVGAATSERRDVEQAPARRRAPGWWALGLTAALCLVIGRATGPREPDERNVSAPARPHEAHVEPPPPPGDAPTDDAPASAPPPAADDAPVDDAPASAPPPAADDAPVDDVPASAPPSRIFEAFHATKGSVTGRCGGGHREGRAKPS